MNPDAFPFYRGGMGYDGMGSSFCRGMGSAGVDRTRKATDLGYSPMRSRMCRLRSSNASLSAGPPVFSTGGANPSS